MGASNRLIRWARPCLIGYWILALIATHAPDNSAPSPGIPHLDKVFHLVGYLVLSFFCSLAFGAWNARGDGSAHQADGATRRNPLQRRWLLVGIVIAYGLVDEATQPWFGRDFDWWDWLADIVGTLIGAGLAWAFASRAK